MVIAYGMAFAAASAKAVVLWSSSLVLSVRYFSFLNAASSSQVVDAALSSTCLLLVDFIFFF